MTVTQLHNQPHPSADIPPQFSFALCQQGAERVIKQAVIDSGSTWKLAFSRPGLITFKSSRIASSPKHPLIRLSGGVIAQITGASNDHLIEQLVNTVEKSWDQVHLFQRDRWAMGMHRYEPEISPLATQVAQQIDATGAFTVKVNLPAVKGQRVLDCIIVEPDRWLIGYHQVEEIFECWPGGVLQVIPPAEMVSRAYLKMAEAIAWCELPIEAGDHVVEIGSSPGGAAQRLLDMGLHVTGVDPAEMSPLILNHPRFEHWRAKSAAVKRKNFRKFKWLVADANVAPNYTLDCVGDVVNYPTSQFAGLILNFKLSSYDMLGELESYLDRIRSWSFNRVAARQLGHNRRELCVVAGRSV